MGCFEGAVGLLCNSVLIDDPQAARWPALPGDNDPRSSDTLLMHAPCNRLGDRLAGFASTYLRTAAVYCTAHASRCCVKVESISTQDLIKYSFAVFFTCVQIVSTFLKLKNTSTFRSSGRGSGLHIRRRQKYNINFVGRNTGGVFPGGDAFVYQCTTAAVHKSKPRAGGARDRETEDRHTPREPAGTCLVCYSLEITENHILLALEYNHNPKCSDLAWSS